MCTPYYEVLYDLDPGYSSLTKTFIVEDEDKISAKAKAEEEAKRLENIGYYIYDIQYRDTAIWDDEYDIEPIDEEDEEEEEETESENIERKAREERKTAEAAKKAAEEEARLATYGDEQDIAVLEVLYKALQQSKKPKMIINYASRFCPRFKSGRFEQPRTIIRAGGREYAFQFGCGWERIE